MQKLTKDVTKAAEQVAKANKIDIVLNEESSFYTTPAIDISALVVKAMDENFVENADKTTTPGTPAAPSAAPAAPAATETKK